MTMHRTLFGGALVGAIVLAAPGAHARIDFRHQVCTWEQWGQSAGHDGDTCVAAQTPLRELDHVVFDPFQFQEIAEGGGDLFVHYQAPLSDGENNFFMMHKAGTFLSCDPPGSGTPAGCGFDPANLLTQVWTEKGYHFGHDGHAEERWTFASDWKPIPDAGFEPMFQPALSGPFMYLPGAGGSVFQILKVNGFKIQRIKPFHTIDPNTYVTGGVTVDKLGFVYWNVVRKDPATGAHTGFIVKAAPWGTTKVVGYENLIPDAPKATDLCYSFYFFMDPLPPFPWPPPGVLPPQIPCGPQRPGMGVTPAIGEDGTIFTATRADALNTYSYMIALHPDLSLRWATSLRGLVNDGCGVEIVEPFWNTQFICPGGMPFGIDGETGLPPAQAVDDASSGAPVALPDGGVVFGATRDYDAFRGILLKFDRHGHFVAHFDFGWDTTPAVYRHDGTYSLITKDNHYLDSYPNEGPFYMSQLSSDLAIEWKYENTTAQSCVRQPDGSLECTDRDPLSSGFEWCVNAPAVDKDGNVVAVNEDGNLFVIGQGGVVKSQVFLNQALGAAYTPSAIDAQGRIYALNNGEMSIFGF
jgi:hypothetical protein